MYNKNQFKKLNDKKLLHKIGKHWVTVSIALLGLLGGGAAATHVNANADTTNNNQDQANHQTNIDQLQNNKDTLQTNDQSNHSAQYIQNSQNQIHNINNGTNHQLSGTIIQRANNLHSRIINHANFTNTTNNKTKPINSNKLKFNSDINDSVKNNTKYLNQNSNQFNNDNVVKDQDTNYISNKRIQAVPIYAQGTSINKSSDVNQIEKHADVENDEQTPVTQTSSDGTININYVDEYTNKTVRNFSKHGIGGFTYTRYVDPKSKYIPVGYKLPEDPIIQGDDIHEFKANPQTLVIGIVPIKNNGQIATVSIQYKDFNGNPIKTVNNVKGLAGAKINYKPYETQSNVPKGYEFAFLNGSPTFEDGDTEYIMVKPSSDNNNGGNSDNEPQQINNDIIYEDDQTGHQVGFAPISGPIDSIVNYAEYDNNNSNYMPKGYHFDKVANVSISQSNVNFGAPGSGTYLEPRGVYRILVGHDKPQSQNISTQLIYENASDNSTVSYAPLSGRIGSKVDYSKYEDGSQYIPKGYHYDRIAPSSSNTLKYGGNYIILVDKIRQYVGACNVTVQYENQQGQITNEDAETTSIKKPIGTTVTIDPRNYQPTGFHTSNDDHPIRVLFTSNGTKPGNITFKYIINNERSNGNSATDNDIASSAAKSADDSIANYYKKSIADSVSKANQSKADSAAQSADSSIANSYRDSIAIINQSLASSAASSANSSIAASESASVSNSISALDNRIASSAANSADRIIANSVSQSVSNSVSLQDSKIASSAASSANSKSALTSASASTSASISNDVNLLASASSAASLLMSSLSNDIKSKYGSDASRLADSYMNKILSYHNNAITNDSQAMNSLSNLRPVNNSISSLDAHDVSKISSNRKFMIINDISMISNFKDMNAQRHAGSFNIGSAITNANNDISIASMNDQNTESILNHDVSELVSMNNSISASSAKGIASTSISNSISASNSASLSTSESASSSASLSNSIKFNAHVSASDLVKNDVNEINSYDQIAQSNDSTAVSELNDIDVSSNASLNALKSNDINEAYDDDSIVNEDTGLVENLNSELRNGSYEPDVAINSANSQITAASEVATDASLIIADDITALESASNQARSHNNHSTSNNNSSSSSVTSSSANINHSNANTINSNEKNINMDKKFVSDDANQIKQYAENSNVSSNSLALLLIGKDSSVMNSAYQAIANDQLNPNIINTDNANDELSSTESAYRDARQVVASATSSAANASVKRNNSNNNIISNNSNSNSNNSNGMSPRNSANPSSNIPNNSNSVNTHRSNVTTSLPNNNHQSASSNTSSDNNDTSKDNDSNEASDTDAHNRDDDTESTRTGAGSINSIDNTQRQSNNSSLPQTGESSRNKAIAAALLALGSLGLLVDDKKHRYNW